MSSILNVKLQIIKIQEGEGEGVSKHLTASVYVSIFMKQVHKSYSDRLNTEKLINTNQKFQRTVRNVVFGLHSLKGLQSKNQ